ncbi:MAG TPA: thiamine-phosphate kinase [Pyrinomonadaceae bacterium]|nr:thiamine-phosphate kinase [Pyrinomonadaceae bacterium]
MNEFDFIRRLREQTRSRKHSSRLVTGIGDDATVISQLAGRAAVVTTDLLAEGIDFYREATPPRLLGHKALAVSLSDIAAMGARPLWSLVSIGLPDDVWNDTFKDEFFEGYLTLADEYGVTLAGGDVSRTVEHVVIDSILLGEVSSGAAVLRSTAQPGDQIFVTGALGGSAAGLKLIEMGARVSRQEAAGRRQEDAKVRGTSPTRGPQTGSPAGVGAVREGSGTEPRPVGVASGLRTANQSNPRSEDDSIQTLLLRHLRPSPRVGWGIVLGEERLASAMIDISDGLSSDLAHLCHESNVGALIQSARIPIDRDVTTLCGRRALDPLALALHGGEDFELLFTVHPDNVARLPKRVDAVAISCIGEITNQAGVIRIAEKNRVWDLKPRGFEHFRKVR